MVVVVVAVVVVAAVVVIVGSRSSRFLFLFFFPLGAIAGPLFVLGAVLVGLGFFFCFLPPPWVGQVTPDRLHSPFH